MQFEKFPKIGRLNQTCTITEKIDGTNAQICFNEGGDVLVGSRKREIFPALVHNKMTGACGVSKNCDNYGFARWVHENLNDLRNFLGEGRHYGEWAGQGIQRNYGLKERRFYLFNSFRFAPDRQAIPEHLLKAGLRVVPILYQGAFNTDLIQDVMIKLGRYGSFIAPFQKPEGIIVYHHGTRTYSKVTFDHDQGKWSINQEGKDA